MSPEELAAKVTVFLTPFLPYLIAGGEATAQELGKQFGKSAIDKARSIWDRLKPISKRQDFKKSLPALLEDPHSMPTQSAVATVVGKYLISHPAEARRILTLMSESRVVQTVLVERQAEVGDILQEIRGAGWHSNSTQEIVIGEGAKAQNLVQKT